MLETSTQKINSWLGICHPWLYFWGLQPRTLLRRTETVVILLEVSAEEDRALLLAFCLCGCRARTGNRKRFWYQLLFGRPAELSRIALSGSWEASAVCQHPCQHPQQTAASAEVSQVPTEVSICCCMDAKRHNSSRKSHDAVALGYVRLCPKSIFADVVGSEMPKILTPSQRLPMRPAKLQRGL